MNEKIKPSNCIKCNKILDAVSAEDGSSSPVPGDLTICFYCGEIMRFNNEMTLEKVSDELFNSFDYELQEELLFTQKQLRNIARY